MKFTLRFLAVLFAALGVLIVLAWLTVRATTRDWSERDMASSADLVVSGARRALLADMRDGNTRAIRALLDDISGGERIIAAAVCSEQLQPIAASRAYPPELACPRLAERLHQREEAGELRV